MAKLEYLERAVGRHAIAAALAGCALALVACGAGTGGEPGGVAAELSPGAVADCPLPSTPAPQQQSASATSTTGAAAGHPGGAILPQSATPLPTNTIPGHPGIAMPSAAPVELGDASIEVGLSVQAVNLHVGRSLNVEFSPSDAVTVPGSPDSAVLRLEGRRCREDGTAVFTFVAAQPGTVVLDLSVGMRCLHANPPCKSAEFDEPIRVDVVP